MYFKLPYWEQDDNTFFSIKPLAYSSFSPVFHAKHYPHSLYSLLLYVLKEENK